MKLIILAALAFTSWVNSVHAAKPPKQYDLAGGVDNLASQLLERIPADQELVLAVPDFVDLDGYTDDLSRYVANRLSVRLSQRPGRIKVVARRRLAEVLKELKLSRSGLLDESSAKKVGGLLGANSLLMGTVSLVENKVDISARIVELETGRSLPGALVSVDQDENTATLKRNGRVQADCRAETANVIYIVNRMGKALRLLACKGEKNTVALGEVQATRASKVHYRDYDQICMAGYILDGNNLAFQTPRETFSNGTWLWLIDGDRTLRTQDVSMITHVLGDER